MYRGLSVVRSIDQLALGRVIFASMVVVLQSCLPGWAQQTRSSHSSADQISKEEFAGFNSVVLKAIKENDSVLGSTVVAWDIMKHNAIDGIDCPPDLKLAWWRIIQTAMAKQWVAEHHLASKGGSFEFRRLVRRNEAIQVVYRRISRGGEGSYLFLTVAKNASGELRIIEMEKPTVAEAFARDASAAFGNVLKTVGDIGPVLTPKQQAAVDGVIANYLRMDRLVLAGRGRAALTAYQSLPPEVRSNPASKALKIQAALTYKPGGVEHRDAVVDFLKSSPADSLTRSFLLMNYYSKSGQTKDAVQEVENIKAYVGPDGWLDTEFALACQLEGNLITSRRYAESAVRTEPQLSICHLALMSIAVAQSDFEVAARALKRMDQLKPLSSVKHIESKFEMQQFVASEPYKAWKAERFKEQLAHEAQVTREAKAFFESLDRTHQR